MASYKHTGHPSRAGAGFMRVLKTFCARNVIHTFYLDIFQSSVARQQLLQAVYFIANNIHEKISPC